MKPVANGYLRFNGLVGIRNRALVIFTSGCAAHCARMIAGHFTLDRAEVLGCQGCADNIDMRRKLIALALHQNVGAVLVVGCGCEPISPDEVAQAALESARPAYAVNIAKQGSIKDTITVGVDILKKLIVAMDKAERAPLYPRDLIIGAECGGSDFTSGLAANPLVGSFFDKMVDLGATLMFEEMYECIGLRRYLVDRCATPEAARQIADSYDRYYKYSKDHNQFYISPGNVRGGLTTIEEKSMGAVIKSGTKPIQGVVRICQKPPREGLWMMDGMGDDEKGCGFPVSNDASSTLLFLTCKAHLVLLTSGRGHLINNPIGPVIKITGNPMTYSALSNDMDLNAGSMLNGQKKITDLVDELYHLVCTTASGKETKGERLGHREAVLYYEKISTPGCYAEQ